MSKNPKGCLYDGAIFARCVDPMLAGLRGLITRSVPPGASVLDACCGTGALVFDMAPTCSSVVGVDLSPRQIKYAERRRLETGVPNVEFHVADVSHLESRGDNEFDLVTMAMAIHEMPFATRLPVLAELARVGQRLIVVDFNIPMPWNTTGLRNRTIELSAGPEHFRNFRSYSANGGLAPLLNKAGLTVISERTIDKGTMVFAEIANR